MAAEDSQPRFLLLPTEVLHTILELLPLRDVCNICSVNTCLRSITLDGIFASRLWKCHASGLLGPGLVALHEHAISDQAYPAAFWREVCRNSLELTAVRWWRPGSELLQRSVQQEEGPQEEQRRKHAALAAVRAAMASEGGAVASASRRGAFLQSLLPEASAHMPLKSLLARSDHTATVLGEHVVVVGGKLRDSTPITDVLVLHLRTMTITTPKVKGTPPTTRCWHTTTAVALVPDSPLEAALAPQLPPGAVPSSGTLLLIFGGCNSTGEQFGGPQMEGLWVAPACASAAWVRLTATGEAPSPRFHHIAEAYNGGKSVVVYGGEGLDLNDSSEYGPCVYVLDVAALVWARMPTFSAVAGQCPGVRALHLSALRTAPDTRHTELVVVGGHCLDVLVEMVPFSLDLETWRWRRSAAYPPRSDAFLPPPRQRAAATAIAGRWLLVAGGQGLQNTFLEDMHKLHLPTLTWHLIPRIVGAPPRQLRRVAGHTLGGLLAFGGATPTIMNVLPIIKSDVLLLAKPPRALPKQQAHQENPWPPLEALPPSVPIHPHHATATRPAFSAPLPATAPRPLRRLRRSLSPSSSASPTAAGHPSSPPTHQPHTGSPHLHAAECEAGEKDVGARDVPTHNQHQQRAGAWRFRMREKRVREVSFTVADVQLRLWRDTATGLLYASRPDNSDYSDSSSDASGPANPPRSPPTPALHEQHPALLASDTAASTSSSSSSSSITSTLDPLDAPPSASPLLTPFAAPSAGPPFTFRASIPRTHPLTHPSSSPAPTASPPPADTSPPPPALEPLPAADSEPLVHAPPHAPPDACHSSDMDAMAAQLQAELLHLQDPTPSRQALLCFLLMFALTAVILLCALPFAGGGL